MLEAQSLSLNVELPYPFISIVEPPVYMYWLGMFLNPTNFSPSSVFIYATLMSLAMPLCWFLWIRNQLRDELFAVLGLIAITWTPSFIGIYSFFQPETLLLILIPISLWLDDSSIGKPGLKRSALSGTLWGLTLATRITAFPLMLVSMIWTHKKVARKHPPRMIFRLVAIEALLILVVYAMVPIKIFLGAGYVDFIPGTANFNRLLYEIGADGILFHVKYRNNLHRIVEEDVPIAMAIRPGMRYMNMLDDKYSEWDSCRDGIKNIEVDYTSNNPYKNLPKVDVGKRLALWRENVFLLLTASSWPENDRRGYIFSLETFLTRYWGFLLLSTAALVFIFRVWTFPTALFGAMLIAFALQQTSIIDGRFRKPLECITIVALIDVVKHGLPRRQRKKLSGKPNRL
jgi:hypothetical protein